VPANVSSMISAWASIAGDNPKVSSTDYVGFPLDAIPERVLTAGSYDRTYFLFRQVEKTKWVHPT